METYFMNSLLRLILYFLASFKPAYAYVRVSNDAVKNSRRINS